MIKHNKATTHLRAHCAKLYKNIHFCRWNGGDRACVGYKSVETFLFATFTYPMPMQSKYNRIMWRYGMYFMSLNHCAEHTHTHTQTLTRTSFRRDFRFSHFRRIHFHYLAASGACLSHLFFSLHVYSSCGKKKNWTTTENVRKMKGANDDFKLFDMAIHLFD